jgi:hypothetical protein
MRVILLVFFANLVCGAQTQTPVQTPAPLQTPPSLPAEAKPPEVKAPEHTDLKLGWTALPNTKLQQVCPPRSPEYDFAYMCQNVIRGWSGGIADLKRSRLILWGGGHTDYYGNELYALDLDSQKLTRLNDPSTIAGPVQNPKCITTLSDNTPNSRHTYSGLAYIAHRDQMFAFGGSLACGPGSGGEDTWILDLATLKWVNKQPTGAHPVGYQLAAIADYNPNDKRVYLFDREHLYSYNVEKNEYEELAPARTSVYMSGVIDPKRNQFLLMGMDDNWSRFVVQSVALKGDKHELQNWPITGCEGLINAKYPGIAYDPKQDRFVVWPNFGSNVYIFNPANRTCATQKLTGGPPDSQHDGKPTSTHGTYGRFRYFPSLDSFVLMNDWDIDAYVLRLR